MEQTYHQLNTLLFSAFAGVFLLILARQMQIPAIAPLLIGGVLLGPEGLGVIDSQALGGGLKLVISISVAVILFEGGLTLDPRGFQNAQKIIGRMLTIGVLITWFGTALAVYLIFGFDLPFAMLAGSLIIVTGPTVVAPLLQRIRIKDTLHHILHWESVLIDPIGVFIAILCFEWLSVAGNMAGHFWHFAERVLIGTSFGLAGGFSMYWLLRRRWIPEAQVNIFVLAGALFLYGISDFMVHEAGILTVVVSGFILGWKRPESLKNIQSFKAEITELSIAVLFILLSARLELDNFRALGKAGLWLVLVVLFLIRPLNIFISAIGSDLSSREKLFLSWVAPRGVVAGSMASLFSLELSLKGHMSAGFLEAFTFSIIAVTILIQGLFSGPVAYLLKVKAPLKTGWLIIGANYFSRKIADFITKISGSTCYIIDSNQDAVKEIKKAGFTAFTGNALALESIPQNFNRDVGYVLALTDNRYLNQLICERCAETLPGSKLYRWASPQAEPKYGTRISGKPVWRSLPKPSEVAFQLQMKESILIRSRTELVPEKLFEGTVPLLALEESGFVLSDFDWLSNGTALLLQRMTRHLPFYIQKNHILRLKVKNYEEVITIGVSHAARSQAEIPYEQTRRDLIKREMEMPTALHNGVAVPHIHCSGLSESICVVIQLLEPIALPTFEKDQYQLFFVLISPAADPELHLVLLADIAKLSADKEKVQKIMEATEPEIVSRLLLEN